MDGSTKSDISSTKTAKNVDGNLENQIASMKTRENVDEKYKPQLSSMKIAKNVDEKYKPPAPVHEIGRRRGWQRETQVKQPSKCVYIANYHQDDILVFLLSY